MKLKEDMPLSAAKIEDDTLANGCSASKQMSFTSFYLHLPPSMSRRYMKLKEDMPLLSGEDRGRYFGKRGAASKLMSFISLYLHLPPFISFGCQEDIRR